VGNPVKKGTRAATKAAAIPIWKRTQIGEIGQYWKPESVKIHQKNIAGFEINTLKLL